MKEKTAMNLIWTTTLTNSRGKIKNNQTSKQLTHVPFGRRR